MILAPDGCGPRRGDSCPEVGLANELRQRAQSHWRQLAPCKPWQNCATESFNRKSREERLSVEWVGNRLENKIEIDQWTAHESEIGLHSSLAYMTLSEPGEQLVPKGKSGEPRGSMAVT